LYQEYATKYRNAVYLESLLDEERKNVPQHEQIFVNRENDAPTEMKLDGPGLEV